MILTTWQAIGYIIIWCLIATGFIFGVNTVLSHAVRWDLVEGSFASLRPADVKLLPLEWITFHSGGTNAIAVGLSASGLYLAWRFPCSLGRKSVVVPWDHITISEKGLTITNDAWDESIEVIPIVETLSVIRKFREQLKS